MEKTQSLGQIRKMRKEEEKTKRRKQSDTSPTGYDQEGQERLKTCRNSYHTGKQRCEDDFSYEIVKYRHENFFY